mgnify:CR=1 FL=1
MRCFICLLFFAGLASCVTQKKFNEVLEKNSINDLQDFVNNHPKSKYIAQAKNAIDSLTEEFNWSIAEQKDTIPSYRKYIKVHNNGLHFKEAKERISKLSKVYEKERFNYYNQINTIEGFRSLLAIYPSPITFDKNEIYKKIAKLRVAKEMYNKAVKEDDPLTYRAYIDYYSYSNYSDSAETLLYLKEKEDWNKIKNCINLDDLQTFLGIYPKGKYFSEVNARYSDLKIKNENQDWKKIKNSNKLNDLRDFLDKYPDGIYFSEINERYVDLKIKKIYEGRHMPMPELIDEEKSSDLSSFPEVSIKNSTNLTITITYSGPSKVFVVIPSRETKTIVLNPGKYKVSAEAKGVIPFFGEEKLKSGENYSTGWIIERRF